eukprot:1134761-Pelagomonas_calceolata.AAC.6
MQRAYGALGGMQAAFRSRSEQLTHWGMQRALGARCGHAMHVVREDLLHVTHAGSVVPSTVCPCLERPAGWPAPPMHLRSAQSM